MGRHVNATHFLQQSMSAQRIVAMDMAEVEARMLAAGYELVATVQDETVWEYRPRAHRYMDHVRPGIEARSLHPASDFHPQFSGFREPIRNLYGKPHIKPLSWKKWRKAQWK